MQKYQTYDKQLFVMNFSTNKVLVKTSGSNFFLFDCPVWCNLTHILSYNRSSRQKAHDSRGNLSAEDPHTTVHTIQYYSTQYSVLQQSCSSVFSATIQCTGCPVLYSALLWSNCTHLCVYCIVEMQRRYSKSKICNMHAQ